MLTGRGQRASERHLSERFSLGHFQGEDLRGGHHGKGRLLPKSLCHAHCDCCLPRAWLPGQQYRPAGDFALLDHLDDHASSLQGMAAIEGCASRPLDMAS